MVRVGADFSAITKQSKKATGSIVTMISSVNRATGKLEGACAKMTGALRGLGSALGVAGLAVLAKEAADAYNEVQENNAALAQVMKNTMAASQAEYQSILDLCDAQEKLGVVDGEVAKAGAVELSTYLGLTSSLQTLIPVMDDMLAQQYGLNATSENAVNIATMLGKVMNGQTGALSRYGYSFTEAQAAILKYGDEAQRAAVLASVVEDSVGGMNEALAQTPSGRIRQVKFALGEVQESFGQAIMTIAQVFLPLIRTVASILGAVAAAANRAAQAIANVFGVKTQMTAATGGISSATSAMDGLTDSTEQAAGAAERLQTFGFDQLQKLGSASSSGSGAEAAQTPLAGSYDVSWDASGTEEMAESAAWLEKILLRLKKTAENLDFTSLAESWGRLTESAGALGETIAEGLGWAYDNVLEPLATWTVNSLVPAFLDLLSGSFSYLNAVLEAVGPLIDDVWTNFLQPVAKWTGGVITDVLELFASDLQNMGDTIAQNQDLFQLLVITVTAFGIALWAAASPINAIIVAIGALVAVGIVLAKNWDTIKEKAKACVDGIKAWFSGIGEWFKTTVLDPIINFFRNFVNGILTFVEGVVNGVINGINAVINAINRIHFDIPDWVPVIGGKSFGFNIPTVAQVALPRLADGAVLRPNQPFAAIVGDQKHGTNVETPLGVIQDALRAVMAEQDGGVETNVEVRFEGSMSALARYLRPYIEADSRRVGKTASVAKGVT